MITSKTKKGTAVHIINAPLQISEHDFHVWIVAHPSTSRAFTTHVDSTSLMQPVFETNQEQELFQHVPFEQVATM